VSYLTVNRCATQDPSFRGRVTACAAAEGIVPPEPAAAAVVWPIAAASDIEAAYASAIAGGNVDPGGDPSVITDQMILSAFQANYVPPAAT
jgi:hypothetical protein